MFCFLASVGRKKKKMLFAECLKGASCKIRVKLCLFYPIACAESYIYSHFSAEKRSRVCDLGAACILMRYSFLCFSMGEVKASLIKSVSHSGGFYSVVGVEGGDERGRGRKRGEKESEKERESQT